MIPAWLSFFDAILAVVLVTVGVLGAHFFYLAPFQGFQLFAFGFVLSLVGAIAGLIGILATRSPARAVARPRAVFGTAVSLLIAVPIFLLVLGGSKYPAINDITTDFDNPPEFTHAPLLSGNQERITKYGKRIMEYGCFVDFFRSSILRCDRASYAQEQQRGYGELAPLKTGVDPVGTFAKVEETARQIPSWVITLDDPTTQTLEGVATSRLFHFHDDFVIEVRPAPDGTGSLIEMRSKSRDGSGDFGMNYKRIRMFFDALGRVSAPG